MRTLALLTSIVFVGLTGCSVKNTTVYSSGGTYRATEKPSAATLATFDKLKALQGDWESTDPNNPSPLAASIRVTSNGSAVREVMFPGQPHEMTNMYHLDGDSIVATHYCAMGNQPRMRCNGAEGNVLPFRFTDVTNLTDPQVEHMSDLTVTLVDNDHIRQDWGSRKNGVTTTHAVFELARKK